MCSRMSRNIRKVYWYIDFVNPCPKIRVEGIKVAFITYPNDSKKKLLNILFYYFSH